MRPADADAARTLGSARSRPVATRAMHFEEGVLEEILAAALGPRREVAPELARESRIEAFEGRELARLVGDHQAAQLTLLLTIFPRVRAWLFHR